MEIINIKNNDKYLKEYITLCYLTWSSKKINLDEYINYKIKEILTSTKYIYILGLVSDNKLIGFISLFEEDGVIKENLTPWYATMYVKKEYRNKGYSRILNGAILKVAKSLGYKKVYLKTTLVNYYEKFNFKYIKNLDDNEKLYFINL